MRLIFSLFFLLSTTLLHSQSTTDYENPMKIPMYLSGNFGELRSNHFHTGLDIKTDGKTGIPIYSIEKGYVSRIKISHYGYGYAVYIDHPTGHTSVYAHLDSFNEEITAYLRNAQYELKEECVYLYPNKNQLHIYKGEEIGKSGNTGRSGGPHLHFEIRDTESEKPLNPHNYGFEIKDSKKPIIQGIMLIPLDGDSRIDGVSKRKVIYTKTSSGTCNLTQNKINVHGKIGIAVKTKDQYNGSNNSCGVYNIKLYQDSELIYEQTMDSLDFSTFRYINSHIVYDYYKENKSRFQKSFVVPSNELTIYSSLKNNGQVTIPVDVKSDFKYVISDLAGNQSTLNFQLNGIELGPLFTEAKTIPPHDHCQCAGITDEDKVCNKEDFVLYIPKGRMYENECIDIKVQPLEGSLFDKLYSVGSDKIPLQNEIILKWKIPEDLDINKDQLTVLEYNSDKNTYKSIGGNYKDGILELRTKSFGQFKIGTDSTPPYLSPINIKSNMSKEKSLKFKVGDDLSGLVDYDIYIDDKWVLGQYNRHANQLTYWFDSSRLERGDHKLKVVLKDAVGNQKTFDSNFTW